MTPHELNLHIEAYRERMEQEGKEDLAHAYLTAYYHRVKRMPNLKQLLEDSKPKAKVKQTDEEMFEVIKKMHASIGGEVV